MKKEEGKGGRMKAQIGSLLTLEFVAHEMGGMGWEKRMLVEKRRG